MSSFAELNRLLDELVGGFLEPSPGPRPSALLAAELYLAEASYEAALETTAKVVHPSLAEFVS